MKGTEYFVSLQTSVVITEECNVMVPIAVAVRSKAWVCGRSLAGIVGSNPTEGMDVCLL
jgi:hypothetical protein